MSSNLSVIRSSPSSTFYRQEWANPDISDESILGPLYYHEAIGVAISRYNDLEVYFRSFVGTLAGLKPRLGDAIFTHIGAVTLIESLKALVNELDFDDAVTEEVAFLCKLFDVNRINRNFIAHSSTGSGFALRGPFGDGILMTKRSARGKLKTDHFLGTIKALRQTADEIIDCYEYIALSLGPCSRNPSEGTLELPHRPPLPKNLTDDLPKGAFSDLVHVVPTPE